MFKLNWSETDVKVLSALQTCQTVTELQGETGLPRSVILASLGKLEKARAIAIVRAAVS